MESSGPRICLQIKIKLWSFQWDKRVFKELSTKEKGDFYIKRYNQPRGYNGLLCILQQSIEYVKIILSDGKTFIFKNFQVEKC